MAFNSVGQYVGNFKPWDHNPNQMPGFEHSEGTRPSIEFKPAAWLPVQFFEKYFEDWKVVLGGKIVAVDNDGRVVPAQYGLTGATITYTANDVSEGVTDVRTGVALLTANIGTFNVSDVTSFMGRAGEAMVVSAPIGVAPYSYYKWAGGDGSNPVDFINHNYQRQHLVAVLCDYVISLPLVPAVQAATSLTFGVPSGNKSASSAVGNLPVATNTMRTPIAFTGGASATLFVRQVATAALVAEAGDWAIDYRTGVVTVYATSQPTSISISYYHYASAPSVVSKFACAVGNLKAGDFVKCDANSNYVVANPASDTIADIMGQVLNRDSSFPRSLMDRVRTAPALATSATGALPGYLGQLDQMPGSATGGMPVDIHYAGAADTVVRVNLISR